jgi:hypothetical protein
MLPRSIPVRPLPAYTPIPRVVIPEERGFRREGPTNLTVPDGSVIYVNDVVPENA